MPIYEYKCAKCNISIERLVRMNETAKPDCPMCNEEMKRIISQTSFVLKGGGWFADSYSSSSADPNK